MVDNTNESFSQSSIASFLKTRNCTSHSSLEKFLVQKILIQIHAPGVFQGKDSEMEDFGVVGSLVQPYRFGPDAPIGYEEPVEEEDEDGLIPAILEARSNDHITLEKVVGFVTATSG